MAGHEKVNAYFPLFMDIGQKRFRVYGAGRIAARRIGALLRYGARVFVTAPRVDTSIYGLRAEYPGQLTILEQAYCPGEIVSGQVDHVLAATDDKAVNAEISQECHRKGIMVNNASDHKQCDFYFPALVEQDGIVYGITSLDGDHKKVARAGRRLRQEQKGERDMRKMDIRPRRLRSSQRLRRMVRETRMDKASLVYPIFIMEGENKKEEIASMTGQYRYSIDRMGERLKDLVRAGVSNVMFFGIPKEKDPIGSGAYAEDGIIQRALRRAKQDFPQLYLIADLCMCEYTSHGHCGILCGQEVDNDKTLEVLARIAVSQVQAGADMVAPSDMMDGRVAAIREALDGQGFFNTPIMAYSAKYASSFYGPFREAAGSAPAFGDRKTYQMDPHNRREALKEIDLDVAEGADIIMVKPAMAYGDLIREAKERVEIPVAAYSVSGEYAMVKAAAAAGMIDEEAIVCEMAACAYRAGTDIYITYFAEELAYYMEEGKIG